MQIPPPKTEELPEIVEFVTVSVQKRPMNPPPAPAAELPEIVELATVSVLW